jgi:hypothetical protein
MRRACKTCNREFEASGRALYCGDACRRDAEAKRKRDWRSVEAHVKNNLADYAEGIEDYRATRGDSRYATADDMAAEASSTGVARLPLVNDDYGSERTRTAPTAIGRSRVRVKRPGLGPD